MPQSGVSGAESLSGIEDLMTQVDPPTLDLDLPIGASIALGEDTYRGECALLADLT